MKITESARRLVAAAAGLVHDDPRSEGSAPTHASARELVAAFIETLLDLESTESPDLDMEALLAHVVGALRTWPVQRRALDSMRDVQATAERWRKTSPTEENMNTHAPPADAPELGPDWVPLQLPGLSAKLKLLEAAGKLPEFFAVMNAAAGAGKLREFLLEFDRLGSVVP
jgi:hypothetical protein